MKIPLLHRLISLDRRRAISLLLGGMTLYCAGTALRLIWPEVSPVINTVAVLVIIPAVGRLLYFSGHFLKERIFFRVRNRIAFFYFFAGLLPIVFMLGIAALIIFLFFSNLSLFAYQQELKNLSYRLHSMNAGMVERLHNKPGLALAPSVMLDECRLLLQQKAPDLPDVSILFYQLGADGKMAVSACHTSLAPSSLQGAHLPEWLKEHPFYGITIKNFSLFIYSHNPIQLGGSRYYLDLFIPFRKALFSYLLANSNMRAKITIKDFRTDEAGARRFVEFPPFSNFHGEPGQPIPLDPVQTGESLTGEADDPFTFINGDTLDVVDWYSREQPTGSGRSAFVELHIPFSTVVAGLSSKTPLGQKIFQAIIFIVIMFLLIEITSICIGVVIIRSVTRSLRLLNRGTEELKKGNLAFEIPIRRRDELGELSRSFNAMAGSIQRLLREVAEKQRMKRELEIAREVQQNFFPRLTPVLSGYELAGRCVPAREVSGDFFDFIPHGDGVIDMVVGDISGKGISAALLMASMQSVIRAQPPVHGGQIISARERLLQLMEILNRHLLLLTPTEKFATAFYASLVEEENALYFCNCGHESPFYLNQSGEIERLETGGTILGVFPDARFEVGRIELHPQDLVLIYTDGIVDATNRQGQDLGADLLLEWLERHREKSATAMVEGIFDDLKGWAAGTPHGDDITLVGIKRL